MPPFAENIPTRTEITAPSDLEDGQQCRLMQKEEFEVLESIYPEYISMQNSEGHIKLEIPVEFEMPRSVIVKEDNPILTATSPKDKKSLGETLILSALPPLLLHVILPPSYPLHSPPEIVSLRATHMWIPNIQVLQTALIEIWRAGEQVLYHWVEHIRTGEFLQALKLIEDSVIMLPHPAPHLLSSLLLAHELSSKSRQFFQNSYSCSICLNQLKGSKCLQLSCEHIFCRSCLEDFWKMCITEGDVDRVGCPDPECVKKSREAEEEEVARVVSDAEVDRWKWLKEKRAFDRDPTVVHCPVAVCQAPVPKPSDIDSSTESGWNRLRQCSRCGFSFCVFCKRTWHGPIDTCPIAQFEDLALEYLGAAEGSSEREKLEQRFGRVNMRRLIAQYEEEKANLQWLATSTMKCPGCSCYVEKSMGCNHMKCWKCLEHFCYRCGTRLKGDNPYSHFLFSGNGCYKRLFDQETDEDDDWAVV